MTVRPPRSYESFRPAGTSESLKLSADQIYNLSKSMNGRFLDVGCGSCRIFDMIKENRLDYFGVDIALDRNNVTRTHAIIADANALPFRGAVFDFVSSLGLIEHIDRDALDNILLEISRVLMNRGTLLLVTINLWSLYIRAANFGKSSNLTFLSRSTLVNKLIDNNLEIEKILRGGKFADVKLPRAIRRVIDVALPRIFQDRIMIVAKKKGYSS